MNDYMEEDGFGRPPKSFEAVVLGATDEIIADILWKVAPAGIEMVGTELVETQDSQGFTQNIKFSRPTEVPIWVELDISVDPNFPEDGEEAIKQDIAKFALFFWSNPKTRKTPSLGRSCHRT